MTPPSDKAVEAAARELADQHGDEVPYSENKRYWNRCASEILQAAEPIIREEEQRKREEVERALQEAEDRFEFCDNCERPAKEGDLKVVWCREEGGELVDARICAVCRLEADLAKARAEAQEFKEKLGRFAQEVGESLALELRRMAANTPIPSPPLHEGQADGLERAANHVLEKTRSWPLATLDLPEASTAKQLAEFDAWLSFRPEFAEVLKAFRSAFGTDTAAPRSDLPSEGEK